MHWLLWCISINVRINEQLVFFCQHSIETQNVHGMTENSRITTTKNRNLIAHTIEVQTAMRIDAFLSLSLSQYFRFECQKHMSEAAHSQCKAAIAAVCVYFFCFFHFGFGLDLPSIVTNRLWHRCVRVCYVQCTPCCTKCENETEIQIEFLLFLCCLSLYFSSSRVFACVQNRNISRREQKAKLLPSA